MPPIAYVDPLGAAYRRMKSALFPFDLGTWFVLGFASWIAGWGTAGSIGYRQGFVSDDASRTIDEALGRVNDFLASPLAWVVLFAVTLTFLGLVLLILWITSRGEFVFLDAVINRRQAIAAPWRAGRDLGNSLFLWRLVVTLGFFLAFSAVLGATFFLAWGRQIPRSIADIPWLMTLLAFAVAWLPIAIAGLYLHLLLRHFVTPLMFRDRLTTNQAWRKFLPLLRDNIGTFVLYGLFVVAIHIGLFFALIPLICVTCCLLGCLLALPVIGAVIWLPISYTLRGLGPEFLAQFGPEYSVWPAASATDTPIAT